MDRLIELQEWNNCVIKYKEAKYYSGVEYYSIYTSAHSYNEIVTLCGEMP